MVILFFVALILAWPTAGLSIVAYISLLVIRSYLQAKTRMHHADKLRAQREVGSGSTRLPSWMADRDKIEEFIYGVQNVAEHNGIPKLFSAMVMNKQEVLKPLMHLAGSMEAQGASFIEQQMAVMEKLIELYNMSDDEEQTMFWGKKKDHSAAIEKIALSLIENGQETGVLPFLSLKEAADYAKDKSPLCSPGFVQCHAIIGDGYYNLEFKPHPAEGVYMSAYYYGKASELLADN